MIPTYTSLQKPADILVQHRDGRSEYALTDHRTFAEVESELDISVAFALVRTLAAVRFARERGGYYRVAYISRERPPERVVQAIASAGGVLEVDHVEQPYRGQLADPSALIDGALRGLGEADAARTGTPLTLEGLKKLQGEYAAWGPRLEVDEVAYWSSVLHLGAFAGEVLRASSGGGWAVTETLNLDIPIVYVCGPQTIFLLSKAEKFLDSPATDSIEFTVSQSIMMAQHLASRTPAK